MTRLTRRQSLSAWNAAAPPGMEREVPAPRAKSTHPEAQLHAACAKYLRIREKRGDLRFHSNLPEGKRDPKRAGWFKAMSGRPGFPDIVVMYWPKRGGEFYIGYARVMFVELKSDTGRLSDGQQEWQEWLLNAGFEHHVIRSVDQLVALFP